MKKSNLADLSYEDPRKLNGSNARNLPLCPKPRRVASTVPDFLKPLQCSRHSCSNDRCGILDIINSKGAMEEWESDGCSGGCSSPTCYAGSPPGRTENPVVHDAHFIHHQTVAERLSPFRRTNLSDKFGFASSVSPAR